MKLLLLLLTILTVISSTIQRSTRNGLKTEVIIEDNSYVSLLFDQNYMEDDYSDLLSKFHAVSKDDRYWNYQSVHTNLNKNRSTYNEMILAKSLINGTVQQIKMIPRTVILKSLTAINKISISLNRKLVIWDIIKNNESVKILSRNDLVSTGNLLLVIPELDLFNLNYSSWDIVDYLGTLQGLDHRRTSIIGYALKKLYGDNVVKDANYINKLKGILCAFPPQLLKVITPETFCLINADVFTNLRTCSKKQREVLVYIAKLSTAYGPTQVWNRKDVQKLGLLVSWLNKDDLMTIRPEAIEGIQYTTIAAMPTEKLKVFTEDQVDYLNDLSLATLRKVLGIESNNKQVFCVSKYLLWGVVLALLK